MSAPDFIWAEQTDTADQDWRTHDRFGGVPYIRRDPAVIAALPEVQALVAAATLDAQLRAFERGRLDTPNELRGDAIAALEAGK